MSATDEFDIQQIFDLIDHLINSFSNKYTRWDYRPHLIEFIQLKDKYAHVANKFRKGINREKDLKQIYFDLLEFLFKYDYIDIPYPPAGDKPGEEEAGEERNNKINFTRYKLIDPIED